MMIQRIRNSRSCKGMSLLLVLSILTDILYPSRAFALTGGPAQPEFSSFTPVGTSDMVDLSSGDFNYNIPLMDVGGYPLNIAYSSSIGMDDEASWVGLGWNLSVGQVNRNVRGIPDDFNGDEIQYENNLKDNVTVGATFKFTPAAFGATLDNFMPGALTYGVTASYNNYTGFSMKPSLGVQMDLGNAASIGFNIESGPDGMSVSPSISMQKGLSSKNDYNRKMGVNIGASFNSRQGLMATTLSMNSKSTLKKGVDAKDKVKNVSGSLGSSISFANMVYTPTKRNAMKTGSFTVNAALGAEVFGAEGQGQITAFGTVQQLAQKDVKMKAYGYAHTDKGSARSILDFNREKDGMAHSKATNLPVTNYTYDIYSVQGQGVSGMYRPYRNQVGFIYDAEVTDESFSGSLGLEFGVGNAAHAGIDIEATDIQGRSGDWVSSNSARTKFIESSSNPVDYEKVHYKNVGDLSSDREMFLFYDKLGGYQPVRVPFVGSKFHRYTETKYHAKINSSGGEQVLTINDAVKRNKRQLRNQAIYNVTIGELRSGIGYGPIANTSEYQLSSAAKNHHIGEVQVLRNDGARYVYGLPAYNLTKKEATFAVAGSGNCSTGLVYYSSGVENSTNNKSNDRYFERITTPAYVHTHLLTSVLSTDYVDRSNNGPTPDDLGNYTKFSYTKRPAAYKWRIPYERSAASYNEGLKSDPKDDQGNYLYGEKEMYYLQKIETKTHIAVFEYVVRQDARGVLDENGGMDNSQVSYRLEKIKLYSVKEYNGGSGTPIKEVNFVYDYSLCKGVPNNSSTGEGKLTLKGIYFTYRNSKMGKYTGYKFNYDQQTNYNYNIKGYDSWGNYKPNTGGCTNGDAVVPAPEFPFVEQNKSVQDKYAAAWTLSSIELPSGGTIKIEYESDDYAYVQDKEVMRMYKVVGAGKDKTVSSFGSGLSETLYDFGLINNSEKHKQYLYVEVNENVAITNQAEIKKRYFKGTEKYLHFRFLMNMTMAGSTATSASELNTAKFDYVTGYAELDTDTKNSEVFQVSGKYYLSIPLKKVKREGGLVGGAKEVHPVAKSAWHFGRRYLNKYAYSNQANGDTDDIQEIVANLVSPSVLNNLKEVFTGPNATLENKGVGRRFIKSKSWVRLKDPSGKKLGGGSRVKTIKMNDAWRSMSGLTAQKDMEYGQKYEYTLLDGISSGVATYEPIGNKENPFVQPVFSSIEHLLAPDEDNYLETPFGESFFPSPQVTYSKVKVTSLAGGRTDIPAGKDVKKLHKTGFVITEFYTSKDYPTIIDQTVMQAKEDTRKLLDNILALNVRKHMTASQGYVVHLNDMNGKQKSQKVYAENQETPISSVEYIYDNYSSNPVLNASQFLDQNKGKLNNLVKVIYPDGTIKMETIGVEYDVVNDFRENKTSTYIKGVNTNLASFIAGIFPVMVPIPLPDFSKSEDQFRSVATTKVINTFGILKETIATDAGSSVYTRNLAWDAMTGEVLVTETIDEFNDKYYTLNYPAHWAYPEMGQAVQNLGLTAKLSGTGNYSIQGVAGSIMHLMNPGDEIIYGPSNKKGWVIAVNTNTFTLMDKDGNMITNATGTFKVIRSGRRNLQSAGIMNVTLMHNPLTDLAGTTLAALGNSYLIGNSWEKWKVINAGAVDYSDYWKASCECGVIEPGRNYNPYLVNEKGVWRTVSSRTYLTGRNFQPNVTPRVEGFFTKFSPFYKLSIGNAWYKDPTDWTFVSEITRYSPYGVEIENKDALNRYSAAQYGYNNIFPVAVGANSKYTELGYDGFEDRGFDGCILKAHFRFPGRLQSGETGNDPAVVSSQTSHTGKYSLLVRPGQKAVMVKQINCGSGTPAN